MAIVRNLADGYGGVVDKSFTSPNRSNTGEPNGALTPEFAGEIVLDTTNNRLWKAMNLSATSWIALTSG